MTLDVESGVKQQSNPIQFDLMKTVRSKIQTSISKKKYAIRPNVIQYRDNITDLREPVQIWTSGNKTIVGTQTNL